MVNPPAINQPYCNETGPPKLRPVLYNVVMPVSTDMIENEKAKLENTLQILEQNMPIF